MTHCGGGKMSKLRPRWLPIVVLLLATPSASDAQAPSRFNVHPCSLLSIDELETLYGEKAGPPRWLDGQTLSTCNVTIGGFAVNLQIAQPGTPGLPTSVLSGLEGIKLMLSGGKSPFQDLELKDFGNIGCYSARTTGFLSGPRSIYTTTCFAVDGGYLNLSMADEDPARASFDVVKEFTEKAITRRRTAARP